MKTQRVTVIDGPLPPGVWQRSDMEPHLVTAPEHMAVLHELKVSTISWDECLRTFRELLPDAKGLGLDEIHRCARCSGYQLEWSRIPNWIDLDDSQILRMACGARFTQGAGNAILVPDICFWGKDLPFLLPHECVVKFVGEFLGRYGEAFFNGDMIMLFPSCGALCLFHHEGLCAKIEMAPRAAPNDSD